MQASQQALFISHGGGPMPLLGDPGHRALTEHLARWQAPFAAQKPSLSSVRTGRNRWQR